MMAALAADLDNGRRLHLLRAMGLQPQVLRVAEAEEHPPIHADLVLVLPQSAETDDRQRALLEKLLSCMPLDDIHMQRLLVKPANVLAKPDNAAVFLLLGTAQQQALEQSLASSAGQVPVMLVLPSLSELLAEPLRKREAWLAIRKVRSILAQRRSGD